MVFLFLSFLFIFFLQILYDHRINLRLCKKKILKSLWRETERERERKYLTTIRYTKDTRKARASLSYFLVFEISFIYFWVYSSVFFSGERAQVLKIWWNKGPNEQKEEKKEKIHTILFAFWGGGLTMVAVWGVKRDLDAGDLRWSIWVSGMGNWISKYPNLFYYY